VPPGRPFLLSAEPDPYSEPDDYLDYPLTDDTTGEQPAFPWSRS
jgi:hypothetical protein